MCLQYIKVKNKSNKSGLSYAYVPCGKCADCRLKERKAWETRLRIEFDDLKSRGWNIGFITLTYAPESLPTIPKECFVKASDYKEIPCFDRTSVRDWIKAIRQYCKYHFGFKNGNNIRYMITSEYGEHTKRPHYHALLAWPSTCDYETMHSLCSHYWTKGLVGPSHYLGDKHCKWPFEVKGDKSAVISYIAKYVAKDISFVDQVKDIDFYQHSKSFEKGTEEYNLAVKFDNCSPFHLQSVSLGYEPVKRMSDDAKFALIKDGVCFVGDDKTYEIPLYVKNKIVYNNYYVVDENGKRLVRREATKFFEEHREELFNEKAKFYNKYINQVDRSFLEKSGVEKDLIGKIMYTLNVHRKNVEEHVGDLGNDMGKYYLAYNAIQGDRCFDIPLHEQWMLRYRRPENVEECYSNENWPLFDGYKLSWLQLLWNYVNCIYFYVNRVNIADREEKEKMQKKLLDFWNNIMR